MPNENGSLSSTVYRKPTHTNLYLQWDSHHTLPSKYSVIGTLLHRAQTICSNPQLLKQEEDHLYRALTKCKYPAWALNRMRIKSRSQTKKKNSNKKKRTLELSSSRNHMLLFLTTEGSVKASRRCAVTMGCRCILKEVNHQKPPDGSQGPRSHVKEKWSHL